MAFSPINLSIASPEEIFQRQAYVNTTAKYIVVYDALGNCHQLPILTQLSLGNIPFSLQFPRMQDYEQNILLQSMKVRDVCLPMKTGITGSGAGELPKACLINVIVKDNGRSSAWRVHSELIYQRLRAY